MFNPEIIKKSELYNTVEGCLYLLRTFVRANVIKPSKSNGKLQSFKLSLEPFSVGLRK